MNGRSSGIEREVIGNIKLLTSDTVGCIRNYPVRCIICGNGSQKAQDLNSTLSTVHYVVRRFNSQFYHRRTQVYWVLYRSTSMIRYGTNADSISVVLYCSVQHRTIHHYRDDSQ